MSIDWKVSPSDLAEALMTVYHDRVRAAVAALMIRLVGDLQPYA